MVRRFTRNGFPWLSVSVTARIRVTCGYGGICEEEPPSPDEPDLDVTQFDVASGV